MVDRPSCCRVSTRICVFYLLTFFLISGMTYAMLSFNYGTDRQLARLREEVDEITFLIHKKIPTTLDFDVRTSKQMVEVIDALLKKRLAGVVEDVYRLKKKVKANNCVSNGLISWPFFDFRGHKHQNRINYAAEELGAKIQSVQATPLAGTNFMKRLLGLEFSSNPPINMLQLNMRPGACFAFKNNVSEVTVKLGNEVLIDSIEVAHIQKCQSPQDDISSAPRTFGFYGVDSNLSDETQLGEFCFDNNPLMPQQLFEVHSHDKYQYVRFKFTSNHGNPNFTCVYRIAVYGIYE